jgi:hypothetical protein
MIERFGQFRYPSSQLENQNKEMHIMTNEEKADVIVLEEKEAADEVPAELKEKAEPEVQNYLNFLRESSEVYEKELVEAGFRPEAGEPIVGRYQYWNVFTRGPYQLRRNFRPRRVIAVGEWALLVGVVWINTTIPGGWVFPDRECRVRFETINLSRVTSGPDYTRTFRFPDANSLRSITSIRWWFRARQPGLYETSLIADLTLAGMPFAAFSTWHFDPEPHPGIPGRTPSIPRPHWQHDIPARYLVYQR